MAGPMRRSNGRRGDLPLTADINVTSLVDVAFTLLVIFIITAPMLQGGIEVNVPRADVRPLTAEDEPFFVSVTRDGKVYVEKTELSVDEFRDGFGQMIRNSGVQRVYVRADSMARWAPVLQVIATTANTADIDFALVGESWEGN